ncbi:hypothetical protein ACFY2R_27735 [Micromonospora olivasterospora]|uniref:Uncharacterized protein n=1 Tax=Micromonospora olivasterospora TaxID=1880 RepID=A0A562IFC3_MICOL|nr:RICIN domain-containing protein [Micromonospora olivasterospora]TWH69721.1 hypothetical protein JD77_04735 [Micromonospora olivasterospora]
MSTGAESGPASVHIAHNANRCVDVRDWVSGNGGRLQLWDCTGSANQKWSRY